MADNPYKIKPFKASKLPSSGRETARAIESSADKTISSMETEIRKDPFPRRKEAPIKPPSADRENRITKNISPYKYAKIKLGGKVMFTSQDKAALAKYAAQNYGIDVNQAIHKLAIEFIGYPSPDQRMYDYFTSRSAPQMSQSAPQMSPTDPELQRRALEVAGLGGAFGAGALALNRVRNARFAAESARAAAAARAAAQVAKPSILSRLGRIAQRVI